MTLKRISRTLSLDPASPAPRSAPPVDDVRPCHCPHCGATAKKADRIVLEGHGVRQRPVVVARLEEGQPALRRETCWARRYLCNACGRSSLVLPQGVIHGQLFSIPALVIIWLQLGILSAPVAAGSVHEVVGEAGGEVGEVCAPKGVDLPQQRPQPPSRPRWRSRYRWSRALVQRLPGLALCGPGWRHQVRSLLVDLAIRAGSWEPLALARQAISAHACCGANA